MKPSDEPSAACEILPTPKHVASPSLAVDEMLAKIRECERLHPHLDKFNESKLPPRDYATPLEELAWTVACIRVFDAHIAKGIRDGQGRVGALALAMASGVQGSS